MDEGVCLLPEEMLRTTTMLKKKYICPLYIWISSEPQDFMMASFSRCCQGDARQSRENIIQAAIPKAWLLIHSWSGRIRTPSSWFWLLWLHGHQFFRVKNVNFFFLNLSLQSCMEMRWCTWIRFSFEDQGGLGMVKYCRLPSSNLPSHPSAWDPFWTRLHLPWPGGSPGSCQKRRFPRKRKC